MLPPFANQAFGLSRARAIRGLLSVNLNGRRPRGWPGFEMGLTKGNRTWHRTPHSTIPNRGVERSR